MMEGMVVVRKEKALTEELGDGVCRKILARGGKMMMVEVCFDPGAVGVLHTHPHEQASYILRGSFKVSIDGEEEVLRAGDTFYVSPGIHHGVEALEEGVILDVFTPQREDFTK